MGQAKRNPTAIAAKQGLLPPKPPKVSKREQQRIFQKLVTGYLAKKTGLDQIDEVINGPYD